MSLPVENKLTAIRRRTAKGISQVANAYDGRSSLKLSERTRSRANGPPL